MTEQPHVSRYPVHKCTAKGQTFNGECNVTACSNTGATWYNVLTYALYCRTCGSDVWGINGANDGVCFDVEYMPRLAEMELLHKGYMA